jgi:hypothetical protein
METSPVEVVSVVVELRLAGLRSSRSYCPVAFLLLSITHCQLHSLVFSDPLNYTDLFGREDVFSSRPCLSTVFIKRVEKELKKDWF